MSEKIEVIYNCYSDVLKLSLKPSDGFDAFEAIKFFLGTCMPAISFSDAQIAIGLKEYITYKEQKDKSEEELKK